jgi:hypothetical protein
MVFPDSERSKMREEQFLKNENDFSKKGLWYVINNLNPVL